MSGSRSAALVLVLAAAGVAVHLHATMPPEIILVAALLGLIYATTAVAISLLYRISGVVNLALGITGVFGTVVAYMLLAYGLPWVVAVPIGLVVSAALGAATQSMIQSRLDGAPRLIVVMATVALTFVLLNFSAQVKKLHDATESAGATSREPEFLPSLSVGVYTLPKATLLLLIIVPVLIGVVVFVLVRTRFGLLIRAAADNTDLARLGGISAAILTSATWGSAALLVGVVATLGPTDVTESLSSTDTQTVLGVAANADAAFGLIIWPLAAAAIARGRDVLAMGTVAVTLSCLEQDLIWNDLSLLWLTLAVGVGLLAASIFVAAPEPRVDRVGAWLGVALDRSPVDWRDAPTWARVARRSVPLALVGSAVLWWSNSSPVQAGGAALGIGLAMIGLAVFVESGLAGSLTLAHVPIAALGSAVSIELMKYTGALPIAYGAAAGAGALLGLVLALVNRRASGLLTTAGSVLLALTAPTMYSAVFSRKGAPNTPGLPIFDGHPVTLRVMLAIAAVLGAAALLVVSNLRAALGGLALVAMRDNPFSARAFGLNTRSLTLRAGLLAGGLAGLGGAVAMQSQDIPNDQMFTLAVTVAIVFSAALGGLTSPWGPVVGSLMVFVIPLVAGGSGATPISIGVGIGGLGVLLICPSGLIGLWHRGRDRAFQFLRSRSAHVEAGSLSPQPVIEPLPAMVIPASATQRWSDLAATVRPAAQDTLHGSGPLLEVSGLARSFGPVAAVTGVDLAVQEGEIVTLIGANGAGKTTTFDLVSGFLRPDRGTVRYAGRDITRLAPEKRVGLGLIRTFQDAALFPTLTVSDILHLAQARGRGISLVRGMLIRDLGRLRRQTPQLDGTLEQFGLVGYRHHQVAELSTGTRRIVELASATLLGARMLLLDEPSAGIAQREVEQLGRVLRRLRDELGMTMLVIEHDVPLCREIGNRMVVMAQGEVIADGHCDAVIRDPRVIESYLGTDERVVQRSNAGQPPRRTAVPS